MANPPPVIVQKKEGMGCLGCGCLILGILALLFIGLVAGSGYLVYSKASRLTSPQPAVIQIHDDGDEAYRQTAQKLSVFDDALQRHQAATLRLRADEINTLIARDPRYTTMRGHLFVSMHDNELQLDASLPMKNLPYGLFHDRYLNGSVTVVLQFDPDTKLLGFRLQKVNFGDTSITVTNGLNGVGNDSAASREAFESLNPALDQVLNQKLQENADAKNLLDHAKSIWIDKDMLVIETE